MMRWFEQWFRPRNEASHLQAGRWGEQLAVRYLKSKKFRISGQRVRIGKHDEIDIVAECEGILIFVEVKTRKNENFGRPFTAVDKDKRKRLSRAAIGYLKKQKLKPEYIRFDAVEVIGEPSGDAPEIRHIENAFQLDPAYRLWW